MTRLTLLLLPLLAACAAPTPEGQGTDAGLAGLFRPAPEEPPAPEPLPPEVLAALPAGVPPSVVLRNGDGCYLVSVEVTDPPSGYPLTDANGTRICDGGVPAASVPQTVDLGGAIGAGPLVPGVDTAPPLVPGPVAPPAPLAPLNPT
ncbi:hypothetical protein [Rubellimicrobium roseum]|uniref:hypothetical protein n=1 Tax=Rubellimicrobium roseum TaxID=687525 RepID=UPI00159B98C1|nr:hypothetical protein [Rubellimicrobium roseum]